MDRAGRIELTPLTDWLVHFGPYTGSPQVRADGSLPDQLDDHHLAGLLTAARLSDPGWTILRAPMTLRREAIEEDPDRGATVRWFWLFHELDVSPKLVDRQVTLWLGLDGASVRVFVNGALVGERGTFGDPFWPRDPRLPAFDIPPGLLQAGPGNRVAVALYSPSDLVFEGPTILEPDDLPKFQRMRGGLRKTFNVTMVGALIAVSLTFLALFVWNIRDREYLYLSGATFHFAVLLTPGWLDVSDFDWDTLMFTLVPGIAGSVPLIVLFTDRWLKLGQELRWLALVVPIYAASAAIVVWHPSGLHPLDALAAVVPVGLGFLGVIFAQCLYGWMTGRRQTVWIIGGLVLFMGCFVVDFTNGFAAEEQRLGLFPVGTFLFTASIGLGLVRNIVRQAEDLEVQAEEIEARRNVAVGALERLHTEREEARFLVRSIGTTAEELRRACDGLFGAARRQEQGASEQSSAVEETERTLQSLVETGEQIHRNAGVVVGDAERSREASGAVRDKLEQLARTNERMHDVLDLIRNIARRSEILALNAAIEGAHSSGEGFGLVANQMRQLSESTVEAVGTVQRLTRDIHTAGSSSRDSTEVARDNAMNTLQSARRISQIILQQQAGTEQVNRAVQDIAIVAHQNADASRENRERIAQIVMLTDRLADLARNFERAQRDREA